MRSDLESDHLARLLIFDGIFIILIQSISSFVLVPECGWFTEDKGRV